MDAAPQAGEERQDAGGWLMDSPYANGDPPNLTDDHRYQINDTPVFLSIAKIQGKPRLSFVILETPSGVRLNPPVIVHLATFVSDGHAISVIEFLDSMTEQVITAIEHHRKLAAQFDLTQLMQEVRNGRQN